MEDGEWGEPLLKDCLFSEILGRKSPDLPALPDHFHPNDSFPFDDLNMIPTSTLFGEREQKPSPQGSDSSYTSSQRLPSPTTNPMLRHFSQPSVKQEFPDPADLSRKEGGDDWGEEGPSIDPQSTAFLGQGYEQNPLTGPIPTTGSVKLLSAGTNGTRPRLLIATLPSSLIVRRKAASPQLLATTNDHRMELSPSPPSSDGSAPDPSGCNFGPLRNRSKMHELAIKQRLITEQDPRSSGCVSLSAEERRTLIQEGYPIPSKLPLNKQEEESLKIVRRKIKNKLSAQESRRKRKEYMETLEQRVQSYHSENASLRQRLRQLEASNRSLGGQLKKVQSSASSGSGSSGGNGQAHVSIATQTSVCLTALVLLFAVCVPTMPAQFLPGSLSPFHSPSLELQEPPATFPDLPHAPPPSVTRSSAPRPFLGAKEGVPGPSRTLSGEERTCEKTLFPQNVYPEVPVAGGFLTEEGKDPVRGQQEELWLAAAPEERRRNLSAHCPDCPTLTHA